MAMLFTNRALCYLKLKKWDQASTDCRHALELDNNIVKGYYFLGQALFEQQAYDESIKYLQKGIIANIFPQTMHRGSWSGTCRALGFNHVICLALGGQPEWKQLLH